MSGIVQYLRKSSLLVGTAEGQGIDLSALRFRFSIHRGDIQTPNTALIRVYNVNDDTAKAVANKEFSRLIIQGGYEGNFGVLFDGEITQVRKGRESQTDTYLDFTAADGDSAYNFAFSALSLDASTTSSKDQVAAMLKSMAEHGITEGYIPDFPQNKLVRGKVLFGMTKDLMRCTAFNTSTNWSIQDGKLVMVPLSAYLPGEIPEINSGSGMIGFPEQTQNGVKVRCLLNPNLKIGQAIKLNNADIQQYAFGVGVGSAVSNLFASKSLKTDADGLYYVMIAEHEGDSRGEAWYTDLLCLAVDATVPLSYKPKMNVTGETGPIRLDQ